MIIFLILVMVPAWGYDHGVGAGEDNWWITYPDEHTNAGGSVEHPSWILEALKEHPVLLYVHLNCDYCIPQTEAIEEVMQDYADNVTFFDLAGDGSDKRATEAIVYDPNGGKALVPLTVLVTLVKDANGDVVVGWHSSEDVTGADWLRSYISDAIELYTINRAEWAGA